MKTEIIEFTGYNGTSLPGVIWQPEGEIKAVLQITHGMTEHMEVRQFCSSLDKTIR